MSFINELKSSNLLGKGYNLNTMEGVKDARHDMNKKFISIHNEITGVVLDEEIHYKEILDSNVAVLNLDAYLTSKINSKVEELGLKIPVTTIFKSAKEQAVSYVSDMICTSFDKMLGDFAKSLCSNMDDVSVDALDKVNEYITDIITEGKKEALQEFTTSNLSFLDINKEASTMDSQLEVELAKLKTKFGPAKEQLKNEAIVENIVSDSAAFSPETNNKHLVLATECNNMIDGLVKTYSRDRLLVMVGGNTDIVEQVLSIVNNTTNDMYKLVSTAKLGELETSVKGRLTSMQINLIAEIQKHNVNVTNSNANMSSNFNAVVVDSTGEPIVVEDSFGNEMNVEDLHVVNVESTVQVTTKPEPINLTPDVAMSNDNAKMIAKYPDLESINNLLTTLDVEVIFSEIGGSKQVSPIISATVFAKNIAIGRDFYIDLNGTIYCKDKKIMLLPESGILEDGYMFKFDNLELLTKYITGADIKSDLELADMINIDTRALSKILDLSSIHPTARKAMVEILAKDESIFTKALQNDLKARFKLTKMDDPNNFKLESHSGVKKSFLEGSCARTKQTITCTKGKLTLSSK